MFSHIFLQAKHTPGSEVGAAAEDAIHLTTVNQDLRQAYGQLAKLKGVKLVFCVWFCFTFLVLSFALKNPSLYTFDSLFVREHHSLPAFTLLCTLDHAHLFMFVVVGSSVLF